MGIGGHKMSEIEKMYKNAGVKTDRIVCYRGFDNCIYNDFNCHCHNEKPCKDAAKIYPPFTAERQLELIKLLQRKNGYKFSFSSTNDNSEYLFFAHKDNTPVQDLIVAGDKCYEEALAGFINTLWQDLTEQERTEIKRILEC